MVIGIMLLILGTPYILYIILQIISAIMYQRGKLLAWPWV
ncbi:hypothetical protein RA11412_0636 [Rothia aeria]|uniref:Uncharacterized protein n=1 Tax=Rothia aeria TaxID=172042 RepID=A0A2Z5QWW6_9MICC|nr:hypothetical protein RA11412_0636 [Rothia aeria]